VNFKNQFNIVIQSVIQSEIKFVTKSKKLSVEKFCVFYRFVLHLNHETFRH
jgi:hypothetical protein